MIAALLLAGAVPQTALDAERAFAAMAQEKGQWTAFRAYAGNDAVMFVPQPVVAQEWLHERTDPPASIRWQPAASYMSCDGSVAVNTGAWQQPDGTAGYFTTMWQRQADGSWRWMLDHGDALATPRAVPVTPRTRIAACAGTQPVEPPYAVPPALEGRIGWDGSRDGSVRVNWRVDADGGRRVSVRLWTGRTLETVIDDHIAAPLKP